MTELARSQAKFASLRAVMENSQAEKSQPLLDQKSRLEEAMNELAKSQAKSSNF